MEIRVTCNGQSAVVGKRELEQLLEDSKLPWFKTGLEYYIIGEQQDLIFEGEII